MTTSGTLHIAILDTDPKVVAYIGDVLADRFMVSMFSRPEDFNKSLDEGATPDLLIVDWHLSGNETEGDPLSSLAVIRANRPSLPIVFLTCSTDLREFLAATRIGEVEVFDKSFRKNDIDKVVHRCLDASRKQVSDEKIKEIPLNENISFVSSSKCMQEIELQCTLVARADIPVLLLGESGTGKEVAAMLIHKLSTRSQRSFLKLNCAAMPADLLESELFGYEQGAFTGAMRAKPGKFELCDKGTIFLDEIGEMPAPLQAKLLQVLQDGSFSRLGSRSTIKVDVRVIAATNIDIKSAIALKAFREDLYYRLNGFTIKMPPLRERTEEIPVLAAHFMRKAVAKLGCEPLPISSTLMRVLTNYTWPGNLRELENTIKRHLVLRDEKQVIEDLLPMEKSKSHLAVSDSSNGSKSLKVLVRNLKDNAEASAIAQTLEVTGWNRKAAASDLNISYKALLYKIKQYKIISPGKHRTFENYGEHVNPGPMREADVRAAAARGLRHYGD